MPTQRGNPSKIGLVIWCMKGMNRHDAHVVGAATSCDKGQLTLAIHPRVSSASRYIDPALNTLDYSLGYSLGYSLF